MKKLPQNELRVRNPLTGDRVCVRDYICDIVDSSRFDILRALDDQPLSPSDLKNQGILSRQTASKHFIQLTDQGLTKPAKFDNGYELTAGGKVILDAVEFWLDVIDRETLASLTRSAHSIQILRNLSESTARPRDLTGTGPNPPSRATVQRALDTFLTEEWCSYTQGIMHLLPFGRRVLASYNELAITVEQVIDKAPWFQRLNPSRADVPVQALSDATVLVTDPGSPGIVLAEALKLCDPRLDHFRVLTSIFNPRLFRSYDFLLKLGLKGEAIVDASVYHRLHDEGMEHFLDDSDYDNFRILRLGVELTLGIGLYDNQKVAIGAYNETGAGNHIAMMLSSNEELVDWGNSLYESIREQAWHPNEHSLSQ